MKRMATGMLVVMAGVYLLARAFADLHPAIGFVKAFAEAAMVGGLADWFAVTALFRHPLGLPIPHTAIIPRNKDRIGDTLAQFLKDNFLTPAVVARRMRHMDVAAAAGRFLADPDHGGAGRLREGASRLLADILDALDDDRLGGMAKGAIASRIRALEVSPLLGQSLEAAMAEGRHIPLLDGIINRAALIVASNEEIIRDMVHERAGRILRWTGLDENVADALITGLNKLLYDMADFPDHPLRIRVNEMLADLGYDLQHDREMQAKVARLKEEIVENPAMQRWIDGLWEQARAALLRAARDPDKTMAGKFGEALRQLGTTLQQDDSLRDTINRFARRATVGATASYGDSIVRLVSDTVRGWDASRVTERVENAVGRDLQYIRINGTLVGGLVGLGLHAIDVLL
ncbi:MAG: DUF445 domain-containing protein [Sphingomonadales bacterium]|nr:DUF445 domain-containing protein [Sphingomonadales bacterium]MBK6718771.1 DUF445 domain-containing protein [Sphingomonadales bacterium]MBK8271949.1 DUF445 domain-containing protein [Sphingomonadales bacterium]MBK8860732.1 DUF445 domain-containing protein [Sphingomonadales bacterium]MBP7137127.1 DUF445 domain-containing protein [Sphingomonadaceae bacterium]